MVFINFPGLRYSHPVSDLRVDNIQDVVQLLENGPYVSWRQKTGKTSFAWAVASGQAEVVKVRRYQVWSVDILCIFQYDKVLDLNSTSFNQSNSATLSDQILNELYGPITLQ